MIKRRKICVVTGSRAEYGLLYWVLKEIERDNDLELQLVVTGMHLSSEFGSTYQQIVDDGFDVIRSVDMLLSSDSATGIAKSMGLGLVGFADVFHALKPDIVLVLGDRFELLSVASAALVGTFPIAHIHGGEVTEGAFDEAIRHSITKMAHLHFTATETYRKRVIQLGEHPDTVFNVGAPGLEHIQRLELLSRPDLEKAISLKLGTQSLLVTWHPATLEPGSARHDFKVVLDVLENLNNVSLLFTKANADPEGRIVNEMIDDYVTKHRSNSVAYASLGQLHYLSALKHVDGVIGNSSSGIIEAPSLMTGTINIGDRQLGRIRADSVIDCKANTDSIRDALDQLFSKQFQRRLAEINNPYGSGDVAIKIVHKLRDYPLENILKKSFFDIHHFS